MSAEEVDADEMRDLRCLANWGGDNLPGRAAGEIERLRAEVERLTAPSPSPSPVSAHEELRRLAEAMHRDSCAWFPTVHDTPEHTIRHAALGLGGETGEVLDIIKKADICGLTDSCALHADGKHGRVALAAEMADVLTYLLVLAHELGIDLGAAYSAKRAHNVERWGDPGSTPSPSPVESDLGPWCCYAEDVGVYDGGVCTPDNPVHDSRYCGYDNVRRGLVSSPVESEGERVSVPLPEWEALREAVKAMQGSRGNGVPASKTADSVIDAWFALLDALAAADREQSR